MPLFEYPKTQIILHFFFLFFFSTLKSISCSTNCWKKNKHHVPLKADNISSPSVLSTNFIMSFSAAHQQSQQQNPAFPLFHQKEIKIYPSTSTYLSCYLTFTDFFFFFNKMIPFFFFPFSFFAGEVCSISFWCK